MDERIAKASKVPFVIRFVRLGRVAFCWLFGCFVWLTEGRENGGNAPIRKSLIVFGLITISVYLHIGGLCSATSGRRNGSISPLLVVH